MNTAARKAPRPRLLHAALAAAARGWPVFPLFPGSKRPALPGWPDHATCDTGTIEVWWAAAPYNIGIACGPARLLVVDLDGSQGMEAFTDLARRAGGDPLRTYSVATPAGEHRYFTASPSRRLSNTVGRLAPQIDTRAAGGYVVAAGSTRPIGGRQRYYRLASPPDLDPARVPDWLEAALTSPTPAGPGSRRHEGRGAALFRPAVTPEVVFAEAVNAVRMAPTGTRNVRLFQAALRLGRLVAAGLLEESRVHEHLRAAGRSHVGTAGFTSAEGDRAIANGLRYALDGRKYDNEY